MFVKYNSADVVVFHFCEVLCIILINCIYKYFLYALLINFVDQLMVVFLRVLFKLCFFFVTAIFRE